MTKLGEEILNLRRQGKSYNAIAEQLGCSKATISYHVNPQSKKNNVARSLRARKKRLDRINEIKESTPCVDCGKYFEGYLMDFDHLPGHIKVNRVSWLIQNSNWEAIIAELVKCELVCCMCHRKRTKERWLTNPLRTE